MNRSGTRVLPRLPPLPAELAYFFGPVVVFWLLAAMAGISVVATLRVPAYAIDYDVARGMDKATGQQHRAAFRIRGAAAQPQH